MKESETLHLTLLEIPEKNKWLCEHLRKRVKYRTALHSDIYLTSESLIKTYRFEAWSTQELGLALVGLIHVVK
jgi:hypothetical protein